MQNSDKIRILYIAGWGRSGSTLMDQLLGQHDAICSVGEIRFIYERMLSASTSCGCGDSLQKCLFWSEIFKTAHGTFDIGLLKKMVESRDKYTRTRHIPILLRNHTEKDIEDFANRLHDLYRAIINESNCEIIVDSSKLPSYALLLDNHSEIDLYILHIVRDPRATAYSWQREKMKPEINYSIPLEKIHPVRNALMWLMWNRVIENRWKKRENRYLLLKYEDFVSNTERSLDTIFDFIDIDKESFAAEASNVYNLNSTHSVAGNPVRFNTGSVKIKSDDEWKKQLDPKTRFLVNIFTFPDLLKYGYYWD